MFSPGPSTFILRAQLGSHAHSRSTNLSHSQEVVRKVAGDGSASSPLRETFKEAVTALREKEASLFIRTGLSLFFVQEEPRGCPSALGAAKERFAFRA